MSNKKETKGFEPRIEDLSGLKDDKSKMVARKKVLGDHSDAHILSLHLDRKCESSREG